MAVGDALVAPRTDRTEGNTGDDKRRPYVAAVVCSSTNSR